MGILEDIQDSITQLLERQTRIDNQLQAIPIAFLLLLDIRELGWEVSLGEEKGSWGQPDRPMATITKDGETWRSPGNTWLDALANAHKTALAQQGNAG